MTDDTDGRRDAKARAVPSGRLSRLGQFGRLAGGVAGGMIAEGARRLAEGSLVEATVRRDQLSRVSALAFVNSLRGWIEAELLP